MKPLPDNTGAQTCSQTGTTTTTLSPSSLKSLPSSLITHTSSSSSSTATISNDHINTSAKQEMASCTAQDNGSNIQNSSSNNNNNNNNKTNSSNSSNNGVQKGKGKPAAVTSESTKTINSSKKSTSGKTMETNGSSLVNGNSNSAHTNGHSTTSTTNGTGKHRHHHHNHLNGKANNNNNNSSCSNNSNNINNGFKPSSNGGGAHYHAPHYHFPQPSPGSIGAAAAILNVQETDSSQPVFLEFPAPGEACLQNHQQDLLASINALRKQGQFCDIKLLVEEHEIPAHRAVLAASSPFLFDFLSCLEESDCLQPIYRVKDVPYAGFQHLLEYMYTGKLRVPLGQVPVVYGSALMLRMDAATKACADFLSRNLTEANCLVIRRFSRDTEFRGAVDEYIRGHMDEILNSKSFFGLTNLQVEVVGLDESIGDETMERRLFSLVLQWAKTNLNDLKPKMDRLTEQVNVLYLNPDNTLMDCADMEDSVLSSDDDMVIDYKKAARRRSKTKHHSVRLSGPASSNGTTTQQPFHKFSLNPEEALSMAEREWCVIATHKASDNAFLSIAVLDDQLMAVSVHVRPAMPAGADANGSISAPDSPTSSGQNGRGLSPILRKASIAPLESMSTARCAMGALALDGQTVVFGGYDRGECLQSTEAFSLQDNQWSNLPPMKAARGRFDAAALDGFVYVCGGSDGWKELSCVERFEPTTGQWSFVANMIKERSSHGVATLNGKLYCVGGSDGQRSIRDCEVYDPATNKWSHIAPLNYARTQTCVCAYQGELYAIGGTDLWNTLNTVEIYNPEEGKWVLGSNLNIARRGAGVDIVDGTMVVVGGSDGIQSLTSTEVYSPETSQWAVGPPMLTPRANLSAVTVGSRLFAIGGFDGKKFLNTLEWLDSEDREWLGHVPRMVDSNASGGSSEEDTKVTAAPTAKKVEEPVATS